MKKDEFYYLGRITKPFGNKGYVAGILDVDDPAQYENLESVFIDLDGEWVPFLVNEVEIRGGRKVIIHFEDVNTFGDAEVFSGRGMYLPLRSLPQLRGKKFYYHEVKGFTVIDKRYGKIGILAGVMDLPRQPLLQIISEGKEILVPLIDEVIIKVDRTKKELHIHAPEGLIEFYSG